jgi:hypothetical protein
MSGIKFNSAAFKAILTSSAVKAKIKGLADDMAAAANSVPSTTSPAAKEPYYEVQDGTTDRARYRVRTTGLRAARHEAKTQALQRNL